MRSAASLYTLSLALIASALMVRLLSLGAYPLMDTTEARYGEMARIMVETGNWLTPMFDYGVPFWGKPPLFAWLSAASMQLFGVNEWAARLPHFALGLGCLWLVHVLARGLFRDDPSAPALAVAVLASLGVFNIITGAVMTDAALLFAVTLSMGGFWLCLHGGGRRWGYAFFVGIAIGLLAKGPLAPVLVSLAIAAWVAWNGRWRDLARLPWRGGVALCAALALPWYILAERATPGFLDYFIVGEHLERYLVGGWQGDHYGTAHEQPRGMIWPMALMAALPWTPLLLWQLGRARRAAALELSHAHSYLWCWLLAPLVLFSFSGNILASYTLPAAPACALLLVGYQQRRALPPGAYALGFATPVLVLAFVLVLLLDPGRVRAERDNLHLWRQQAGAAEALVYLGKRPFSAQFYSAGRATLADDHHTLAARARPYAVAVPASDQFSQKHLRRQLCEPLGLGHRYQLFRCH